jgi:ADP-heptose:LPS heptosyltransferase
MQVRNFIRKFQPNVLDRLLQNVSQNSMQRVLIVWNRGLGDIALGLYTLCDRIRQFLPGAKITFLTRKDLEEGFALLKDVRALVDPYMTRGEEVHLEKCLSNFKTSIDDFDLVLEKPDPTRWLHWQLGKVIPRLRWEPGWDAFAKSFLLAGDYIGIHLQTETGVFYSYEKNWPYEYWVELIEHLTQRKKQKVLIFGVKADPLIEMEGVTDLRGKTNLFELIAIIKRHCRALVAPDSGILSLLHYIEAVFPIRLVSLWADPRQGVLKQNVASPNPLLEHIPLIATDKNIKNITKKEVLQALTDE